MKILFSGGGTLGSVTPLLAMSETLLAADSEAEFLWVGTKGGPEKALVQSYGLPFIAISSGKLRRYGSWQNVFDALHLFRGFFQSLRILRRERPVVCIAAGGFVSVPLHAAAWLLRIPTWVHQQDVNVGLANRLMARFAKLITTALQKSTGDFLLKKNVRWIGNPVRREIFEGDVAKALETFKLTRGIPVVLIVGGGTGSVRVNELAIQAVQHLQGVCQIIHLTGKDRPQEVAARTAEMFPFYHPYSFLMNEMKDAYAVANLVVARGGFGTLSEIAALQKPAIIIPKGGHQEENVSFFSKSGAVEYVHEEGGDGFLLAKRITDILGDEQKKNDMSARLLELLPPAKPEEIAGLFLKVVKN